MVKKRKPGALYFTDVARVAPDAVVLTGNYYALEDTDDFRIVLISLKRGTWGSLNLAGIAHAVRCTGGGESKPTYHVLERNRGIYRVTPPDGIRFERIDETRQGFLMDLRRIGQSWYAVGGHHQIYRETGGRWSAFDDQTYIPGEEGQARILTSIDGSGEDDIYAVGFNGVILHFDGREWIHLESPTNLGFQRVLCADGDVYLCGNANGLYRGVDENWKALTEKDEKVTFWDMAHFKGVVYACTKKSLFTIVDDELREVKIPVEGPIGFYRMDADEDELWTCGNECLLKFDGETWTQYRFPDNE